MITKLFTDPSHFTDFMAAVSAFDGLTGRARALRGRGGREDERGEGERGSGTCWRFSERGSKVVVVMLVKSSVSLAVKTLSNPRRQVSVMD